MAGLQFKGILQCTAMGNQVALLDLLEFPQGCLWSYKATLS